MSGNEKPTRDRLNTARELLNQFSCSEFKNNKFKGNQPTVSGVEQVISVGNNLTNSQKKAKQRLRNKATYYLSLREFSTQELSTKLRAGAVKDCDTKYNNEKELEDNFSTRFTEKKSEANIEISLEWLYTQIDELIEDFKSRSLISDARFTEQLVHARKAKFGSARIAHELKQKGVEDALISVAITNVITDEFANATDICRKKYKTPPANRNEWASRARFLQSRGFSFDVIKKVLNQNIQDE